MRRAAAFTKDPIIGTVNSPEMAYSRSLYPFAGKTPDRHGECRFRSCHPVLIELEFEK